MAPHFFFPQTLRALEEEHEDGRLYAQNSVDTASLHPSELEEFVKGVSFDLSDKELFCIEDQDIFDRVYSLIRGYSSLPPSCKFNLVESLRSNFSVLLPNVDSLTRVSQSQDDEHLVVDRVASHRNAFKIYTFFLINIVLAEESNIVSNNNTKVTAVSRNKRLVNSWSWEPQRSRILNLVANSLEINLVLLFGSSDPDENYLSFIVKNTFSMFENAILLKDLDAKDALCRIVGACATKYHYMAQSCASIMHLIHKYDFVVTHMADAVAGTEKRYADGSLASSIIRDIGRTNPKDYVKDTAGAENIGRFLVELTDRLPKLISTNIGLLVPHFGGESYKIRNALVGVLGKLVAKAFKDVEGEVSSKSVRLRTKQAMLEILLERCRDVSAYTRSRVLQVWAELCEEHAVSIGMWNEVAEVAAGRLEDKSSIVRKSALNLLITMLQHNPFGPQLRIASFEATLEQYKKKLNELEPDVPSESVADGLHSDNDTCNENGEIHNVHTQEQQESLTDSCLTHVEEGIAQKGSPVPDVGNLEQTRALVASLEAGLRFSKCVSATMPTLIQLMASSSASDVENTILLLMRCKQFQIDGSEACLRKMLPLVFSQDKSIYEAVENAFVTIYIRKNPVETAKNLLSLAIDSNIGDLAALEFIIAALVSKGDISTSMTSALWDFFCFNVSGTTAEQSCGALSILCMAAKSSTGVLSSHLQDIIDIGFGRWAKVEPLLARTACIAIQRLSEDDQKKLLSINGSRVIGILESLVSGFWLPENIWYAAADEAIAAIYTIYPIPETLAADLVKKSLSYVFDCSGGDELQHEIDGSSASILTTVQVAKLSRYLFIVSHVAMNQLVYIESCARKIQKQKVVKERADIDRHNINSKGAIPPDSLKDNSINAELGLASSEEAILDNLSDKAEKEIISGGSSEKNLIGHCASFLSKLSRNFSLMQKVKGYINEMAIRVEDEDERISSLAKLFFHELSKKGNNPIYNLLPDILGKLSKQNLIRESFCNVMQFLIGSIKKDKQMESLVEKLCNRFSGVTDITQWEYISYCLSQLAFTEKGMKKLMESFKIYEHALLEDSVMDHFRNIINKGKKFAKPELKLCIEEFEDKLNKFHIEKKDQEATARNAQIHQQKVDGMEGFAVAGNIREDSVGSDTTDDETEGEVFNPSTEGMTRHVNGSSNSKVMESDEYSNASSELIESEPAETEVQSAKVNIRGASKSKAKRNGTKYQKNNVSASTRSSSRSPKD
ncbi:condensin complex subunit 1 isoform X3 [Carya illinoinensis]|uniref:condensin complex subunit 1 isoform X3 n=1 Tax=Carya illinoinensis TaxID=32201 RepID=UPI001C71E75B|nr:condensin complex subunit 1 isoform X3 [Carya illinoinensis]